MTNDRALGLNAAPVQDGGDVVISSSNRPELNLVVRVHQSTAEKIADIVDELRHLRGANEHNEKPGAAIVFMPHTGGSPDNVQPDLQRPQLGRFSAGVSRFAGYLERELVQRVSIYHGQMENDEPTDETTQPKQGVLGDLSGRRRQR